MNIGLSPEAVLSDAAKSLAPTEIGTTPAEMVGFALLYTGGNILAVRRRNSKKLDINKQWGLPSCKIPSNQNASVVDYISLAVRKKYGFQELAFDQVEAFSASPNELSQTATMAGFLMTARVINPDQLRLDPRETIGVEWKTVDNIFALSPKFTQYSLHALGLYSPTDADPVRVA